MVAAISWLTAETGLLVNLKGDCVYDLRALPDVGFKLRRKTELKLLEAAVVISDSQGQVRLTFSAEHYKLADAPDELPLPEEWQITAPQVFIQAQELFDPVKYWGLLLPGQSYSMTAWLKLWKDMNHGLYCFYNPQCARIASTNEIARLKGWIDYFRPFT